MKKDKMVSLGIGEAMMANPVLAHMRKVAYTPVTPIVHSSKETQDEALKKAEAKRLRKQTRNIQNEQK